MLFLIAIAKIILYILLFKGGKTDNGLSLRALACFGLTITNVITIFLYITSNSSIILPVIMIFWWLILGIIILKQEKK